MNFKKIFNKILNKKNITKNINQNVIKVLILFFWFVIIGVWSMEAKTPSFDDNFANFLTDKTPDQYGRVETVFNFSGSISRENTIVENIRNVFYPSNFGYDWWFLRNAIRVLMSGILFLFLIMAWVKFIMNSSSSDDTKKASMSIVYIWYWMFLILWSIWILWYVLNIENVQWSADLVNNLQNNLFLQILTFFKVLAFFFAIVMMVLAGFKMMSSMDKEDKVKAGQKAIVNIIVALVLIKIIDYIFYMAQLPEFAQKAWDLILSFAKILGWVIGIAFVLALFYSWYMMFVAGWDEKAMKKTKWILTNIAIVSVVIFFFLLIIYQIFNEFAG